ncbi:MAG: MFS transporter [Firmicutes bacterium]|nr:MFS transporter [Bacillota bacterium]
MEKPLRRSIINLFGIPSLGFQFWVTLEIQFFSVFLSDYALLPVAILGVVMIITGFFDVFWVPIGGIVLEKTNLKWGKFHSWMLIGPPIALLFYIFQFAKIGSVTLNAVLITIGFAISHLVWNIFYTGHLALNSVLSQDSKERVTMSSNRGMFNALGAILFSLFISQRLSQATSPSDFTWFAFWGGLVMIACYYILTFITMDYAHKADNKHVSAEERLTVWEMIKQIFVNPPLLGMLIGDVGRYLGRFVIFGMAVYFMRDVMSTPAIVGTFFTGMNISLFVGALLARPIATKIGDKNTYALSLVIFVIGLLLVYFVPMSPTVFLIIMFITYLGYGMPDAVAIAMYANSVDYGEWKTGKNARGFIMSLYAFPLKIGILLSRVVIPIVLGIGGYVAGTAPTPQLISALRAGFTLVPAVILVISFICIYFLYRITPESLKNMQAEIAARKSASA